MPCSKTCEVLCVSGAGRGRETSFSCMLSSNRLRVKMIPPSAKKQPCWPPCAVCPELCKETGLSMNRKTESASCQSNPPAFRYLQQCITSRLCFSSFPHCRLVDGLQLVKLVKRRAQMPYDPLWVQNIAKQLCQVCNAVVIYFCV